MRPDTIALHHASRVKATAQTRAEYASAITGPARNPYPTVALWLAIAAGAIAVVIALFQGAPV